MKKMMVLALLLLPAMHAYSQFGNFIGKSYPDIKRELNKSTFSFIEKKSADTLTYAASIAAVNKDSSMTFLYNFKGDSICRKYFYTFRNFDYNTLISDLAKAGYKRSTDTIFQTDKYKATILNPKDKKNFLVQVDLRTKK